MIGFNPGAFIQGIQAGEQVKDMRQNRQLKQEQLKMQQQQLAMQQRTTDNQNFEMDLIRKDLKAKEAKDREYHRANMQVIRDKAINDYTKSLKKDTFLSGEFGGNIKIIQDWSKQTKPNAKVPQIPNPQDTEQRNQMRSILRSKYPEVEDMKSEDLEKLINVNMLSGEYILTGNGKLLDIPTLGASLKADFEPDAHKTWERFLKAKKELITSSIPSKKVEQDTNLYNQYKTLERTISSMKEAGDPIPQSLQDMYIQTKTKYLKEAGGSKLSGQYIKEQEDIERAKSHPTYKGEAEDLENFHSLTLKDKDKYFDKVQTKVEGAKRFVETKDRLYKILEQAGPDFNRDAVSTAINKAAQFFDGGLQGLKQAFKSGSTEDLLKAQAAFDRIETTVGYPMVQLIKEISGAAVTNEEREYLMNLVVGGEFKNLAALTEKLDEFTNLKIKEAKSALHRKVTGGYALRPNWAKQVENSLNSGSSSNIVGSTLPKNINTQVTESTTKGPKLSSSMIEQIQQAPDGEPVTFKALDGTIYKGTVKGGQVVWH